MDNKIMPTTKTHHGRNIKRLREMLGVKQEDVAMELGITQQMVSKIEQNEVIEDELLEQIAKIMKVTADTIKNFSEDAAINFISNTFTNNGDNATGACMLPTYANCTFDPVEKIMELYERMLKAEQEKNAALEKLLANKK